MIQHENWKNFFEKEGNLQNFKEKVSNDSLKIVPQSQNSKAADSTFH